MTATPTRTLRTAGVAAARDYRELPAWQKSMKLAEKVYEYTDNFPAREYTGLAAQMRASVVAIPSSIAAASGRNNEHGMNDSYSKAQSATAELSTQITLATRLGFLDADYSSEMMLELDELVRLLIALKHGLKVAAKDAVNAERDAAKAAREERAQRDERPRREFRSRDGEDRPRREFKSRDGEDRPRREYKPRDGGEDRPRREYKPRDGGEDRPRREYKSRDGGDRKPYGDKKPYGDRKPYGDKKPYGDRKPRDGGKPFRKPRD